MSEVNSRTYSFTLDIVPFMTITFSRGFYSVKLPRLQAHNVDLVASSRFKLLFLAANIGNVGLPNVVHADKKNHWVVYTTYNYN